MSRLPVLPHPAVRHGGRGHVELLQHTAAAPGSGLHPAVRRLAPAAAWAVAGLALFAALLRISLGSPTIADGANPAL